MSLIDVLGYCPACGQAQPGKYRVRLHEGTFEITGPIP